MRRAGLGDAAHVHAARAVLGGEVRALDLHFLNHVVVQGDDDAAVAADVDERRAVERDRVARRADAVDGVALRVVAAAAEADRLALLNSATTPGRMRISSRALRPMTERFSICFAVSTPSRAPVSVWITSCDRGDRDRFRAAAPTSSLTSSPRLSAGVERERLRSYVLKPVQLDFHVVGAGEQPGEEVLTTAVADRGLHGVGAGVGERDVAPGSTPPVGSCTVPRIVAVEACPRTVALVRTSAHRRRASTRSGCGNRAMCVVCSLVMLTTKPERLLPRRLWGMNGLT